MKQFFLNKNKLNVSLNKTISGFFLISFLVAGLSLKAQSVANYTVARTTGNTYSTISSTGLTPSGVGPWRNVLNTDDNLSATLPIGFPFVYNGVVYTQFAMSTNGFLTFNVGNSAVGSGTGS